MIQQGEIECDNTGGKIRINKELWEGEGVENISLDFTAERFKPLGHLRRRCCSEGDASTSVEPEFELICNIYCG